MRPSANTIRHWIVSSFVLGCLAIPARSTEKYWIAHEAQLIVVGTFNSGHGFWWTDGWHETGAITVNQVLYGESPSDRISFRLTIRCYRPWWKRWLPAHPMADLMEQFGSTGLWFLRRLGGQTWEPANDCDSGYRQLSQRADFERYVRSYKH
jgi:hypothetical protein